MHVTADQLLDVSSAKGGNTLEGLQKNLYVAVAYTASWLAGNGAVAIHNLMEDAATAEICRAQVWQQIRNQTVLSDTGDVVTKEFAGQILNEQVQQLHTHVDKTTFARYYLPARDLIADLCLSEEFIDFLTIPAYEKVI